MPLVAGRAVRLRVGVCTVDDHHSPLRVTLRALSLVPILIFALLFGGSSVALAGAQPPVTSLLEFRRNHLVMQEWDLSCGAAALATILTYQHGDPVSERAVAGALIRRQEYIERPEFLQLRQGFSLLDLKRYVEQRGYAGMGYGMLQLADLVEKAPLLVPVNLKGYNHFVVFRGRRGDRVLLADPAYGNRTMAVERFEAAWIEYPEFGRVGFAVARRDGLIPPNRLAPRPRDFVMLR